MVVLTFCMAGFSFDKADFLKFNLTKKQRWAKNGDSVVGRPWHSSGPFITRRNFLLFETYFVFLTHELERYSFRTHVPPVLVL